MLRFVNNIDLNIDLALKSYVNERNSQIAAVW